MSLISKTAEKMVSCSRGDLHDINHFMKVWTLARIIAEQEGMVAHMQEVLELTAIVHDISCPLCREKYGNTDGKKQELESPPLVEAFFRDLPVDQTDVQRISWLVAHHHTYTNVDGLDHQILLEADYLVNAGEKGLAPVAIQLAEDRIFKTKAGKALLHAMYFA